MVSPARSDALSDPTSVLESLFSAHSGPLDDFPVIVQNHFDSLFADEDAFLQIPQISLSHPPESYGPRALVRFRGMVQDTPSPEIYASTLDVEGVKSLGGWGLADTAGSNDDLATIDYSKLRERSPLWVVTVPGEAPWIDDAESTATHPTTGPTAARPHKFPIDGPHLGIQVKVYGSPSSMTFKPTEVVTFIGILSSDSLSTPYFDGTEAPPDVPTIHVLFTRKHTRSIVPSQYPLKLNVSPNNADGPSTIAAYHETIDELRAELISWIAEEALCGDVEAAEWVLMVGLSRVQSRSPAIFPPSLTLSRFPSLTKPGTVPTLHVILGLVFPSTIHLSFPLNLLSWSEANADAKSGAVTFAPHSENEDLHAGVLQLPAGTVLTVLEAGVQEGQLPSRSVENLQTLRGVLQTQSIQYKYPFTVGAGFEFPTDLPCIVLCEGGSSGKSLFLPDTELRVRLTMEGGKTYNAYKPPSEIRLPASGKLQLFRKLICGAMIGTLKPNTGVSKYIQEDFVKERLEGATQSSNITPEDLMLRLNLVRSLALSYHETEVTTATWDKIKALDRARRAKFV